MATLRDTERTLEDTEDFNWMDGLLKTETKPKPKKKGLIARLFSTSPEKKAKKKAEKARRKSRKQIEKNMKNMEKRRIECKKKGMRLSPNGDCEPITPPGSPTASGQRASIGRDGEGIAEYLKESKEKALRKKMDLFGVSTPPPSEDEWSDGETTQDDIAAAERALGRRSGGRRKRRRKSRRKTRRKKKRKSRRKSRKRRRKRKTKRRR